MNVITLTTDFGLRDWFVGTMKGVILGVNPKVQIVDISHEVSAGDIRSGAFVLAASYRFFPRGTVHAAVIDPGVGSDRTAIAVLTDNYFFIAPDNGLLSLALRQENIRSIHRLENCNYFANSISHTFHGRDVFAPVSAHLSRGVSIEKLGPPATDFTRLNMPSAVMTRNRLEGEVLYVDRFGNAITNIAEGQLAEFAADRVRIMPRSGKWRLSLGQFYEQVAKGKPLGLIGSNGLVEIAINGGNAARVLSLKPGSRIIVREIERNWPARRGVQIT